MQVPVEIQLWHRVQLVWWEHWSAGAVHVTVSHLSGMHSTGKVRWGSAFLNTTEHLGTRLNNFPVVMSELYHYRVHRNCSIHGKVGRQYLLLNLLEAF